MFLQHHGILQQKIVGTPPPTGDTFLNSYNPTLWIDASDLNTITLSGSNITQINDKSSNGFTFTVEAGNPTLTNGGMRFDEASNLISNTNASVFDGTTRIKSTVLFVAHIPTLEFADIVYHGIFGWGASSTNNEFFVRVHPNSAMITNGYSSGTAGVEIIDPIKSSKQLITWNTDNTANKNDFFHMWHNTTNKFSENLGYEFNTSPSHKFSIGRAFSTQDTYFGGYIFEIAVWFDTFLNPTDLTTIQNHLISKWSI